ncbi:MAG: patatin-like phospholipase family protein [Pseudomonadota bacterium]
MGLFKRVLEADAPLPEFTHSIRENGSDGGGISLALGGGAARGWAHIGVLRALDEAQIPIKMIAGTSIGALVGGCYLAGKLDDLEDFALSLTARRIMGMLDFSLRGKGIISGYRLAERMAEHLGNLSIEDLDRHLVCVATEIDTGHEIWLTQGDLTQSIRASYSLPGIFEPVTLGDRVLVDGALVNPVPVSVCRAFEAEAVVAVTLSGAFARATTVRKVNGTSGKRLNQGQTPPLASQLRADAPQRLTKALSVTGSMVEAFNIITDRISRARMAGDPPDFCLNPRVGEIGMAEFHRAKDCIAMGYAATRQELPRLRELAGRLETA